MNLLCCLGLVWILKDSLILEKPRSFLKSKSKSLNNLLSCSMCLGVWVGLALAFFEFYFAGKTFNELFYYPFAVSAFCWFFDSLMEMIQYICLYYMKRK